MRTDIFNITLVAQFIGAAVRHIVVGIKNFCLLTQFIRSCRMFLFTDTYVYGTLQFAENLHVHYSFDPHLNHMTCDNGVRI